MSKLTPHDLEWAVKRLPKKVTKLLQERPHRLFVAGGYIRSRITGEKVSDIDLFAPSYEEAKTAIEDLTVDGYIDEHHTREELLDLFKEHILETDNAFTAKGTRPMVQAIHRWTFDTPEEAIQSFDFTIAKAAIWWNGINWMSICHPDYYADLAGKRLVYTSPVRKEAAGGSLLRVLKFYQKGYRIPLDSLAAVTARLVNSIDFSKVDDNDPQVISKYGPLANKEEALTFILSGLLREVDPNIDPEAVQPLAGVMPDSEEGGDA